MNRRQIVIPAALVLAAMVQWNVKAQFVPLVADPGPGGGFSGSHHDFSGVAAGTNQRGGGNVTTGACTFCHTPHKAYTTRLLWNHTLSSNTFSWTDITTTIGGTTLPTIGTNWTGPSRFCLSCHDGSVAVGDIAWFNRRQWTGAAALISPDYRHNTGQFNIAVGPSMNGNHPVGHPYPYQRALNTYNNTTTGTAVYMPDFNADPTSLGIRLFNDDGAGVVTAGAVVGRTGIECTSCHGVHNEVGVVFDEPLLRGTKGGTGTGAGASYICMKCHAR